MHFGWNEIKINFRDTIQGLKSLSVLFALSIYVLEVAFRKLGYPRIILQNDAKSK